MFLAAIPESNTITDFRRRLAKPTVLLMISLGLLWFSEQFSPIAIFEPQSNAWSLWMSYAKDLIQPFAFYFLICLGRRWLQTWGARAVLVFAIPTLLEIGQGFYYRISTSHYVGTFDPIDISMYAISVGLAVLMEQKVFAKLLKFW